MQSRINEATSVLTDAMSAWSELDEPPQRVDIQRNIQVIENTTMAMKEEMKSLAALQRMKKTKEMNQLQQEAQQLRTKELHITDLLQPFQEQITDLVDAVEQKVKEFTTVREQADQTEDSHINQTLLDSAQERAEVMKNEVAELREKLQKTSQKAKEKLQQETPAGSGSGRATSKC